METIDYAEMLEIPVSTVNVVKRKARRKRTKEEPWKEQAINAVNESLSPPPAPAKRTVGKAGIVLLSEFVAACLLCTFIFLTNIFYDNSAINTFSRSLFSAAPKADTRTYSDFTLSGVVSERAGDVEIAVSSSGVLSFTADAAIYPIAEGTVQSVIASDSGYTVEIGHSDSFRSVIVGLRDVYCSVGDSLAANLPMGYADGDVRVMLYSDGTLLNCFTVDDENGIRWI